MYLSKEEKHYREDLNKKRVKKLVDKALNNSSEEVERMGTMKDSPIVKLAKEIGKDLFYDEMEARPNQLEAMWPMIEDE